MTKKKKKGAKAKRAANKNIGSVPANVGALKLREACQYLGGIHPATLRRLVQRGLIRPNRILRHVLFPVSELDRVLEEGMVE
jgi:excisionase family DNA binding protein